MAKVTDPLLLEQSGKQTLHPTYKRIQAIHNIWLGKVIIIQSDSFTNNFMKDQSNKWSKYFIFSSDNNTDWGIITQKRSSNVNQKHNYDFSSAVFNHQVCSILFFFPLQEPWSTHWVFLKSKNFMRILWEQSDGTRDKICDAT